MCASKVPAIVLAVCLALPGAALAQSPDKKAADAAREQARRLQQANRQLEQEKSKLASEKVEAEGKLKEFEGKLGEAQRKAAGASRKAAELGKELDALREEKDRLAARLAETEKRLAETGDKLRKEEGERKQLEAMSAQQKQAIAHCESLNTKLHAEGVALLEKYRSKSCFEASLQNEPFTGLKRVEVENFVEDSRDRLDELKLSAQPQPGHAGR